MSARFTMAASRDAGSAEPLIRDNALQSTAPIAGLPAPPLHQYRAEAGSETRAERGGCCLVPFPSIVPFCPKSQSRNKPVILSRPIGALLGWDCGSPRAG